MMSLKGSWRHAGIFVAEMVEEALVVATAVIEASDEMVADVEFLPTGRARGNPGEVPRF